MKARKAVCLAIIFAASLFYVLTIRAGQPWPDDFAMYIHEAKNLAQHTPLSNTGYIYDPQNASLGPRLYPPVFPLMLVPGYDLGGLNNLTPMKLEIVFFLIGVLFVLWRGLGPYLSFCSRVLLLVVIAFNPVIWSYKDLITSDIPFMFFFLLALAVADSCLGSSSSRLRLVWQIPFLVVLVYVCYGIRALGIVLVPAVFILGVLNWRLRAGRLLIGAAFLSLVPCAVQMKFLGGEASYLDQLRLGFWGFVSAVVHNVATYAWSLSTFWDNSFARGFRDVVFICITLLALVGYVRRLLDHPRIYEIALPLYLAIVLLWPNPAGARYLLPVFPLYVYYCFEGIESIRTRLQIWRLEPILAPVAIAILLSYCGQFIHSDFGPYGNGVESSETKSLFAFVRSNTNASDVFVFRRPRAFALYTDRSASIYPEPQNQSRFASYFQSIHASYLVEAPMLDDFVYDRFIESQCPEKQLVFSNTEFRVFRVTQGNLAACKNPESEKQFTARLMAPSVP